MNKLLTFLSIMFLMCIEIKSIPARPNSNISDNDGILFRGTSHLVGRPFIEGREYDCYVRSTDDLVDAINAANNRLDRTKRFRIFIFNGIYTLPLSKTETISSDDGNTYPSPITYISADNISFIGESRDGVIITNSIPNDAIYQGKFGTTNVYDGIGKSDVLQITHNTSGLYFQDLTIKSGMEDSRGRNIAVQDKGTRNIYKNVCLWGFQDTWTSNNDHGLYYFEGGLLRGRTDFLCGKGDILFNECIIQVCMRTGGYITAPSKSVKYGYVFNHCTINGEDSALNGKYHLGRPWGQGTPMSLWVNTVMNITPTTAGWTEMHNGHPKRFAEYNSTDGSGKTVDLSGRKTVFGDGEHPDNVPVLTKEEAEEAICMTNIFREWVPTKNTEEAPQPKNLKIKGNMLKWDNDSHVFCWAVVKDGKIIGFTKVPKYKIDDKSASYAVRAANEMGGFGKESFVSRKK